METDFEKTKKVLTTLREAIDEAVSLYNKMNPNNKLEIGNQNTKDVRNVFVCAYNQNCVGLFTATNYYCTTLRHITGTLYLGVDSPYVAIKEVSNHGDASYTTWEQIGKVECIGNKNYVTNCVISKVMSFDDMRVKMVQDGTLPTFTPGKATSSEMVQVLSYASIYYDLDTKGKAKQK